MDGKSMIVALKRKFHVSSSTALAKQLGVSPNSISVYGKRSQVTARQMAELLYKACRAGGMVDGKSMIAALQKVSRRPGDAALAKWLGISVPSIHNYKKRSKLTGRQLAGLIHKARRAGSAHLQTEAIRPIVEFFPVAKVDSRHGKRKEVFGVADHHPYREGLKEELERQSGVYVFFDSRGHAIYTGRARKQRLWQELNAAFNRRRGEVQKIRRVRHPTRKQAYRTSDERVRQIDDYVVPLHEIARYFSAYQIADGMIDDLEALLMRCFANDLLNGRMERFGRHRGNAVSRRGVARRKKGA